MVLDRGLGTNSGQSRPSVADSPQVSSLNLTASFCVRQTVRALSSGLSTNVVEWAAPLYIVGCLVGGVALGHSNSILLERASS
jgi:hypothetical protein